MTKTVVALFDDFSSANNAVRDLVNQGFAREDISLMANDASGEYGRQMQTGATAETATGDAAGVGAGVGAAIGGVGGLLAGIGALGIPVIGPVIAAGPLAAALSALLGAGAGAVVGGIAGGLVGTLVDIGVPEEEAQYYLEGVRRGGTLVVVQSPDHMVERARNILNSFYPVDLHDRSTQWRNAGWNGFSVDETDTSIMNRDTTMGTSDTGVASRDFSPSTTNEDISDMRHDRDYNASMAARPTGEYDTAMDASRDEFSDLEGLTSRDRQMDIGHPMPGSGTYVRDDMSLETPPANVGDIGMDVDHSRMDNDMDVTGPTDMDDFYMHDARFRDHYAHSRYASDYPYSDFQPAYEYGYQIARDERYRGRSWPEIAQPVSDEWERKHPITWERFKDSVRYAWEQFKDAVD